LSSTPEKGHKNLVKQLQHLLLTGLPHGQEKSENQEKSGKTKKNDKSQVKMGGF